MSSLKIITRRFDFFRRFEVFYRERQLRWLTRSYFSGRGYRRIYHYHNRKTAGTSLNSAFWGLAGLDLQSIGKERRIISNGLIFVRHDHSLIEGGTYFFANSHAPAHTIVLPPKTFTISIFRDPLSRTLSYYRYLRWAEHNMDRTKEPSAKELQTECQRLRDSFTDFIDNLPREDLLPQLYMFSSTFDVQEAVQRINRLSAVCFTETFTQDIRKLGKQLKLPLLERNERQFNQSVSVSDREKALAREALQEEYDLLDRVKQNWG